MQIERYVLVDRDGCAGDYLYESLEDARRDADDHAIVAYVFEFSDSELVETPDGSNVWPPQR